MKFSVLLPTRNRLLYLTYAIETVRRQDYDDWEIVVSDNDSEEDIRAHVESLNDPRIRYVRTESFIPVTDNWNNALRHSSGDYVIMLGDDDGLMKGYFRTLAELIKQEKEGCPPDAIYTGAYLYDYPNAMPEDPECYLRSYSYAPFFQGITQPTWLDSNMARELVAESMRLRVRYGYNMQFVLISRAYIDSLAGEGPFFQSPYPDYYAMNILLMKSHRVLICPQPLVTIGVTPKSFGSLHFKKAQQQGNSFLNNLPKAEVGDSLFNVVLPGSSLNTCWLYAMETISRNYPQFGLRPAYSRYRFMQMTVMYKRRFEEGNASPEEFRELVSRLSLTERLLYGTTMPLLFSLLRLFPPTRRENLKSQLRSLIGQLPKYEPSQHPQRFQNILEVFECDNITV